MLGLVPEKLPRPSPSDTAEAFWRAVVDRDTSADGKFVFAVSTTSIYCRASCPSRRARRENVTFYATPSQAEAAGYRACKRCSPAGPAQTTERAALVTELCRLIESSANPPSLAELAKHIGKSPSHTQRLFKSTLGVSPHDYAQEHRRKRVDAQLRAADSVTEAAHASGHQSLANFYATAKHSLGMTPQAYRAGGAGETIHFAVAQCSLGPLLVAATARGLCAILMGEEPEALIADLAQRFPACILVGANADFERIVSLVVGLARDPASSSDLPLDIRGTAFQRQVWAELRKVPAGETVSYAELATRIGKPSASRAVAQACAKNPLAIAIPCHRVIRQDGGISGYRWGVERKRELLRREGNG